MKTLIKTLTTLTAIAFIMIACSSFSYPKQKKLSLLKALPDSLISVQLGNTLADVLLNPSSVTMYTVKGKEDTSNDDFILEPHYVRDSLIGVLSSDAVAVLEFFLITDEANYRNDTILVRSPYMPRYEFEFTKKKQSAHILVSTSDFSWTVIYDGKKQFNYNYKDNGSIERYFNLILNREDK